LLTSFYSGRDEALEFNLMVPGAPLNSTLRPRHLSELINFTLQRRYKMKAKMILITFLLVFVSISAEASEKIKLNAQQLVDRINGYEVIAGTSNNENFNYMVVAYSNGTREVYWNDGLKSGTDKGTHRIVGDQICIKWNNSYEGKEQCYDVFSA
jgi:hypothetical protein